MQCDVQSCFQVGYGFVTATLQFPNEITSALDCKRYCATIFIDPSKAFDSIDHSILAGRLVTVWRGSLTIITDRVTSVEQLLSQPL